MPYEYVNRTTDRYKSDNRQEISCPVHSHYVALLFVGLRSCHSGCAQQALPECFAYQYHSLRPDSGHHLFWLFPHGDTCGHLHQSLWLSSWCGLRTDAFRHRFPAFHPRSFGRQFLCLSVLPVHHRLRTGVLGDGSQSLCHRVGQQGDGDKSPQSVPVF